MALCARPRLSRWAGHQCHAVTMERDTDGKPLLPGHSALRIHDFCLNTGLARATVEDLIRAGRLDGWLWTVDEPSRPVLVGIDDLPSREVLAAMGLPVRDDYDPDHIRSYAPIGEDGPFGW
jgi:hypothetical protein